MCIKTINKHFFKDIFKDIERTIPVKNIKFGNVFNIYISNKLITYESCVNKIIFLFNNTFL